MNILFSLIFTIAIASGYFKNIYEMSQLDFEPSYKAEIIRIIGIFPPVGMIVGWVDIDDVPEQPLEISDH